MATTWSGRLAIEICRAFKLDPTDVVEITLLALVGSVATVTVVRYARADDGTKIAELITDRYRVTPLEAQLEAAS